MRLRTGISYPSRAAAVYRAPAGIRHRMDLLTLGHGALAQAPLAGLIEGARINRIANGALQKPPPTAGVLREGDLLLYDGEAA